ncbi:MAG: efflux RND transporter permease subunit [Verrucomicrobiota bacterium]
MIRWFTNNGVAANFLMLGILLAGAFTAFSRITLEVTPKLTWDTVMISMLYRGGTAKDVERAILIPIEEALEGVGGIRMLHADGSRGHARFFINAKPGTDLRALMDDVKARIDAIETFPDETERPRVFIPESANVREMLTVAVTGELDAVELRDVARRVMEDLLELPGISLARLSPNRQVEIAVEAQPEKLRAFDLSFQQLADAIRRYSIDLPAGAIDSESGVLVVRTRGQAFTTSEFESIPVKAAADGAEVRISDVATVTEEFVGKDKIVEFNGQPAHFIEIMRTGEESAIDISNKVQKYIEESGARFSEGIELHIWKDTSYAIRGRLSTLTISLLQGMALVAILLGIFLRPALAFWVVIGIPVSFAGGVLLMPWFGVSANVMSLFGFIIVVGVVVDDAIITGENVYSKLQSGLDPTEAAVAGTKEVAVPVTFGILTTIIAFVPLLFFEGIWGDFAKQIPPVVAPVLLFSLLESKLILPAHLKHVRLRKNPGAFTRFQKAIASSLEQFVERVYQPSLAFAIQHRAAVLSLFIAMGLLMGGYCMGGRMKFQSFPSIDTTRISAQLDLPNDTPIEVTHQYIKRIDEAAEQLKEEFVDPGTGESLIRCISVITGGTNRSRGYIPSQGLVQVEVVAPDLRSEPGPKNSVILARWTELIGKIPEATKFRTWSETTLKRGYEYNEEHLNVELRGPSSEEKAQVATRIKEMIESYEGISSAWASINFSQNELELTLKSRASELGLNQQLLAREVRQAFFGEEAQRVQRGIDSIRVMVRLPEAERRSLHTLEQMKVRTPRGAEVPLETVADVRFVQAPSFVERNDGAEVLRIGGQPVDENVDIVGISKELGPRIQALCNEHPELSFQWAGYVAEAEGARQRTILGSIALLLALWALLAIPFKSVVQPIFVLIALPFGVIGALLGHIIMDITPSYLSVFGMLALAGVVVNDSLVLVDYVNRRRRDGASLLEACEEAGCRRFRPILLTSITTFAGLTPLMFEKSLHAQFLIPMAVSLGFGVLFATVITLFLIPCSLMMAEDLSCWWRSFHQWYMRPFRNCGEDVR